MNLVPLHLVDMPDEPTETRALLAHQVMLEALYNKNQTLKRLRHEFKNDKTIDFKAWIETLGLPLGFGIDLLVQMALHKRTTLPILVSILKHHFDDGSFTDPCQRTADALQLAAEGDLIDWHPVRREFIVKFEPSREVQQEIDQYQFPLPMVIIPRTVRCNEDTGYVDTRNSIILRKNHHEDDVCLDHINRVNRIQFSVDYDTAKMIANRWRNLDKPKDGEPREEYKKRVKAFEKYDRTAKGVIATILKHGNRFWLTHKVDKRGRIYCQGYHLNYQGTPWNKASIELAQKEIVP